MKKVHLLLIVLLASFIACKKDKGGSDPTPPPPASYSIIEAQVVVPAGSTVDLTKDSAVSMAFAVPIQSNGTTKLPFNKGTNELAWVADKDGNILLLGFISDFNNKISIQTTAQALLYYSLGNWWLPDTTREMLVKNSSKLEGFTDFTKKIEDLFIADPLMLTKGGYQNTLKTYIEQLVKQNPVDINARQILVEDPTIRSGLQVAEYDFKNIEISNYYRRRAHAFVYKTAFKDKNGNETVIKSTISGSDAALKDAKISPTTAFREVIGTTLDGLMGKGMDFAVTKTDPIELPLSEAESEATYKVRIAGPGAPGSTPAFTTAENKKQTEILYEFFTVDIFLPVIMDAIGHKGLANDITGDSRLDLTTAALDKLIKLTGAAISSVPAASDALKNGDYSGALTEFFTALRGNLAGQAKDIMEAVIDVGVYYAKQKYNNPQYFIDKQQAAGDALKKIGNILGVFDVILKLNDYRRLFNHILSSSPLEQWTVKAKQDPIRLEPKDASIPTLTDLNIQAFAKTTVTPGTILEYDWYTSGKYGKLRDAVGHNATTFTSSTDKVIYRSTASSASLGEGGVETVFVTVYVKEPGTRTKLGSDTIYVKVNPIKHEFRPEGIVLTGSTSGTRSALLYIVRSDGVNDLESNNVLEFKIEWSTAGKYGKFYGSMNKATTSGNGVNYECLDDVTKEATETISAKIFVRKKGDAAWTFLEEVKGTVKINNDPKKIILHIPTTFMHGDTTTGPYTSYPSYSTYYQYLCWRGTVAVVPEPKDKEVQSYSLRFYGQKKPTIGANTTDSWTPTNHSFSGPPSYVSPKYVNGTFVVVYSYGSSAGPRPPSHDDLGKGNPGMAEVIITLK